MDNYKYDAFISYRHITPDKPVAEQLQKLLENYIPPKGISAPDKRLHLFRDETELPTSDNLGKSIREALEQSRYLIVVCSPETEKSRWCMEEIEYFKSLHGGKNDNILTLLCSPDGSVVFPESLRFEKQTVTGEDGEHEELREVEPLAANVSAPTVAQSRKKLKTEFLRIAASLLGCTYDDLYGREQRRKNRRRLITAVSAAAVLAVISLISVSALVTISSQKSRIENDARELRINQANLLAKESAELEKSGDLYGAMKSAINALDNGGDDTIPFQNAALYQAAKLSGAYQPEVFTAVQRINQKSTIKDFVVLDGGKRLFTSGSTDGYLWNLETGELIKSYDNISKFAFYRDPSLESGEIVDTLPGSVSYAPRGNKLFNCNFVFVPDGKRVADNAVFYIDADKNSVCRVDPETGGNTWEYKADDYPYSISEVTADGVAVEFVDSLAVLSPGDGGLIASVSAGELKKRSGDTIRDYCYSNGFLAVCYNDFQDNGKQVIDLFKRDGKDFKYQWSSKPDSETVFEHSLMISGDRLYYICQKVSQVVFSETDINCLSLSDGSEIWSVKPGDKIHGGNIFSGLMPAGKAKDYDIVICAAGNQLLLINGETGKAVADELLPGEATQMKLDNEKRVFLTLTDGSEIIVSLPDLIDKKDETSLFFSKDFNCNPDKIDSSNGVYAVAGKNSPEVTIYRTVKNNSVKRLFESNGETRYTGFTFSPDKKRAAVRQSNPNKILIYDVENGKTEQTVSLSESDLFTELSFLGNGFIAARGFGCVKIFDVLTGKQAREYGSGYKYSDAAICDSGALYIFDEKGNLFLDNGKESKTVFNAEKAGFNSVETVYPSPDASHYAVCLRDKDFNRSLYAIDSDGNKTALEVDDDFSDTYIESFCWSPDNSEFRMLYKGAIDFYDVKTGKKTASFNYDAEINGILDIEGSACLTDVEGNLVKIEVTDGKAAEKARLSLESGTAKSACKYTGKADGSGILLSSSGKSWVLDAESFELSAQINNAADADIENDSIITCANGNIYSYPLLSPDQLKKFSSELIS